MIFIQKKKYFRLLTIFLSGERQETRRLRMVPGGCVARCCHNPHFGEGRAALFARKLSPAALELYYSYPGAVLQSLCKVAPGLLEKVYGGLGKILRTAAPSPPTAHLSSTKATACGHSSPDIKEEGCNPMGYSLRTMSVFLCLIQALQCA